jgi:hypothetical protein
VVTPWLTRLYISVQAFMLPSVASIW